MAHLAYPPLSGWGPLVSRSPAEWGPATPASAPWTDAGSSPPRFPCGLPLRVDNVCGFSERLPFEQWQRRHQIPQTGAAAQGTLRQTASEHVTYCNCICGCAPNSINFRGPACRNSPYGTASGSSTCTSCRTSGRLVTMPVPRGRKSVPTTASSTEDLPELCRQPKSPSRIKHHKAWPTTFVRRYIQQKALERLICRCLHQTCALMRPTVCLLLLQGT